MGSMTLAVIVYNVRTLLLVAGELFLLSRLRSRRLAPLVASLGVFLVTVTFWGAFLNSIEGFGKIQVDADLLIAGHTHGGQVRILLFGPVLTLSRYLLNEQGNMGGWAGASRPPNPPLPRIIE